MSSQRNSRPDWDAVIVGSGFSGSLLARILARTGWSVKLVERARHPRFAIGESTTPLANLALERLARDHGLPELAGLATHGRWLATRPEVRRGLKRGFSFYLQTPGEAWRPGPERRLLVAASPNDHVADTHWLRSDVDHLMTELAVSDGVHLTEETTVEEVVPESAAIRLTLRHDGRIETTTSGLVVDASGSSAVVSRRLGAVDGPPLRTASSLVGGHFRGVRNLAEVIDDASALAGAPYAEDRAAVHHLLEEGWAYLLAFDHGVTSAGLLLEGADRGRSATPEALWRGVIERYPTLAALFMDAEPVEALRHVPRVQHRLSSCHGPRWVAMPNAFGFVDPLFSTGIAWSLRAVERLADVLLNTGPASEGVTTGRCFERYASLLRAELDEIDSLVATAYRARRCFDLFAAHSMLYFAAVSFAESFERIARPDGACWRGFLGAGDAEAERLIRDSGARLRAVLAGDGPAREYEAWVARSIEPLNVAGLGDPARRNLYPADMDELERRAPRLGIPEPRLSAGLAALRADLSA